MDKFFLRMMQSLMPTPAGMAAESAWQPAADVYGTSDGWLIKFDLAGVKAEEIELTAKANRLTVRGSRRDWCLEEACRCHQMEISYSHFERNLELPCDLDHASIAAEYREGMLLVRIHPEGER